MAFHMANILAGSSVSMSRPMPVKTKNKHSSCVTQTDKLGLIKEVLPIRIARFVGFFYYLKWVKYKKNYLLKRLR